MQIAFDVLRLLSDGKFHSGASLSQHLKVSRTSIWKGIVFLRHLGVHIQAISGRGYRWYEPMELLCEEKITACLEKSVQAYIPKIHIFNVIPSTNDYLLQRMGSAFVPGTICLSEGQSAGRGRQGRNWNSPLGASIYCSFNWRFAHKLHDLSGLSLVIAIGLLEALKYFAPLPQELGIKWPNDLWYGQAKLAGILLESATLATHQQAYTDMIIGFGMNVAMPWQQMNPQVSDLKQIFGFTPSRNKIIASCFNTLIPMLLRFQHLGFGVFKELWGCYDLLKEKKIRLSSSQHFEEGIAHGVNDRGELYVKVGDMLKAVRYGEVSVRPEL